MIAQTAELYNFAVDSHLAIAYFQNGLIHSMFGVRRG